jgi:hypothetical protein
LDRLRTYWSTSSCKRKRWYSVMARLLCAPLAYPASANAYGRATGNNGCECGSEKSGKNGEPGLTATPCHRADQAGLNFSAMPLMQ